MNFMLDYTLVIHVFSEKFDLSNHIFHKISSLSHSIFIADCLFETDDLVERKNEWQGGWKDGAGEELCGNGIVWAPEQFFKVYEGTCGCCRL